MADSGVEEKSEPLEYGLSDRSIAVIAKLLQIGILTGTDVVDHLRMLRFSLSDNGSLDPSTNYEEISQRNLEKMIADSTMRHSKQTHLKKAN